ncbi:MAG: Asp-tRNA(Asn)/Glu-tRNA(Gln) amidotransferase subunit GatA [Candidatus Aenigmarchaeota archaeon]|nr:Asp-tRNA(Asn)/Glu-tRNA(Gln) amidotransferase subunit GatA [Candidatus Aenigmarchaeota archaeon]
MTIIEECKRIDEKLNCFTAIADKIDSEDLVFSLKDCICTKGMISGSGSNIISNYKPVFDATVVTKLREAGSIIGKMCQDEFGFGTFCKNTYKIPKNPWDTKRSCGGSSGGSGCITAALDANHIAIAESTGGSISCPASFCGVVGLTPTYGLVSRYGLIDYASSLDKIGVMARTVSGCAKGLDIIAGYDSKDSTSINMEKQDFAPTDNTLKIGIPKEYFENVDENIQKLVWDAIKILESKGFEYKEVSLSLTKQALASYYIIAMSEASTNLAKYCGMRYGASEDIGDRNFNQYFSDIRSANFGMEAKRRIILGTYSRMAGYRDDLYLKAMMVRTLVIQDFKKAFEKVDVLAAPTMPMLPPKLSELENIEPLKEYQSDVLTVPINLAGMPCVSVPCGFVENLPVGIHLMGDHLQEKKIIDTAFAYENKRGEIKYPKV